jgi:hypothetical protein
MNANKYENLPQPTQNYHPPSASGKTGGIGYRQTATAKTGSSDYHLSALLNKENKALQNLLAAVELNKTTAVSSNNLESTGKHSQPINAVLSRATASAKQHMQMIHMQQ